MLMPRDMYFMLRKDWRQSKFSLITDLQAPYKQEMKAKAEL